MGWSRGSEFMVEMARGLKKAKMPAEHRFTVYNTLYPILENEDWDTQEECLGEDPELDKVVHLYLEVWDDEDSRSYSQQQSP